MRILIIGGAGYIGSRLIDYLSEKHDIAILDLFITREMNFYRNRKIKIIEKDLRNVVIDDLAPYDALIDCSGVSNDPTGAKFNDLTYSINFLGRKRIADLVASSNIRTYLVFSSCSIYGKAEGIVDEDHPKAPLTEYARCAMLLEAAIEQLEFKGSAYILRLGTLFGYSPNFRYDLVINIFAHNVISRKPIVLNGDGLQQRPFLYIENLLQVVKFLLNERDVEKTVFNVVSFNSNISDVVKIFLRDYNAILQVNNSVDDQRSYQVSSQKLLAKVKFEGAFQQAELIRDFIKKLQKEPYQTRNTLDAYVRYIAENNGFLIRD